MNRHPLGDGGEFHRLEETDQFLGVGRMHGEFIKRLLDRRELLGA